jgi:transposase
MDDAPSPNTALHIIAIGRLRTDQRTRDYVTRQIAEEHSKKDVCDELPAERHGARASYIHMRTGKAQGVVHA